MFLLSSSDYRELTLYFRKLWNLFLFSGVKKENCILSERRERK